MELTVVDTNSCKWHDLPIDFMKCAIQVIPLINDTESGMAIVKARYPRGVCDPWHSHPCAHGLYVLEGTLKTHQGNYEPGHFVAFPEGGVMIHGATDEQDCVVLFITNKKFEIHFAGDKNDPKAPVLASG